MLERKQTIEWLCANGVKVVGTKRDYCTGYIFIGESVKHQGIYEKDKEWKAPLLIINEIPEKQRVTNHGILDEAVLQGKQAEQQGRYYHPEVNEKIDELTGGHSSRIQLESLYANTCLAEEL